MKTVILKWTFEPPDFFESLPDIQFSQATINVSPGVIEARIAEEVFDADEGYYEGLKTMVEVPFLAWAAVTRNRFELALPELSRVHPDGKRDVIISVPCMEFSVQVSDHIAFQHFRGGEVVYDSEAHQKAVDDEFIKLIMRYSPTNPLLFSVLQSLRDAEDQPDHCLFRLYEIRDALTKAFGDASKARKKLGISIAEWNTFGNVCNGPYKESRHRGKFPTDLPAAPPALIREMRDLSLMFIRAYVNFLGQNDPK